MPVKKCFKHLGLFHVYDNVVNLDVEIQKIKLLRMTSDWRIVEVSRSAKS